MDLDETLIAVNSFPDFTAFALRTLLRRGRVVATARLVVALARRKLLRGSHDRLKLAACAAAERLADDDIDRWAAKLLTAHTQPSVAALVDNWPGLRVLTTAAPERYAVALGRHAGFEVIHGSRPAPDGGLDHNVGARKVARLREEGYASVDTGVTDDPVLDAPLLAAARRPLVVRAGVLTPAAGHQADRVAD